MGHAACHVVGGDIRLLLQGLARQNVYEATAHISMLLFGAIGIAAVLCLAYELTMRGKQLPYMYLCSPVDLLLRENLMLP